MHRTLADLLTDGIGGRVIHGILALVLPLTASAASSWRAFRQMMAQDFTDMMVLSIAANGRDMSFSSDTGMAECLVLARKVPTGGSHLDTLPGKDKREQGNRDGHPSVRRAHFVSLRHRPQGFAHAAQIAKGIDAGDHVRRIEDGPYGGTPLMVGEELTGEAITASSHLSGEPWGAVRLSDYALAQTAYALSESKLWLPGNHSPLGLEVAKLAEIGSLGLYDLDITGQPPQGPFTREAYAATATYPSLWNHNARNETHIICSPDSQLHRVLCDLLGFDEATYLGVRRLAAKWCAEPSVHGGKQRPKDTMLVS